MPAVCAEWCSPGYPEYVIESGKGFAVYIFPFLGYACRMAYEVTATRRRPRRFEELAGQEFVVATLKNAIESGQIAHAYLFSGPRGCGKTTTARILARALNCEKGPSATPCGVCPACTEIARGASLDVIEIDGASNTSVNDVRQIKDEVLFPPNAYRYKIYIIDEVHMLSTSAFNALLKTIEEPPPYVVFIFATTELHKVPATIKSRCQQFNFRLVSAERIKQLLADACAEAGIRAEDEALFWIARESTGSVRDAYTLFDQVAAFSDGHITYEKIRDKLSIVGTEQFNELCGACAAKQPAAALEKLDELLGSGVSAEQFTVNCADYLRSLLLIRSGVTKESLLGQADGRFSRSVLEAWSPVQIERGLSIMLQLYRDIRYSVDPRYELELAVSRLCWLSDYVSAAEVKTAIDQTRNLLTGGTGQSGAANPAGSGGGVPSAGGPFDRSGSGVRAAAGEGQRAPEAAASAADEIPRDADLFAAMKKSFGMEAPFSAEKTRAGSFLSAGSAAGEKAETAAPEPEQNAVTADGSVPPESGMTLEQLREEALKILGETKSMVAAALVESEPWTRDGSVISVPIGTPFACELLKQEARTVGETFSRLWGSPVSFEPVLRECAARRPAEKEQVLPEVELLCRMFKGPVIGNR